MANLTTILLFFFFLVSVGLLVSFLGAQREIRKLKRELEGYQGQSEDDLYGRGKFSELGLLSAGITHEISNPLSVILGRVTQMLRAVDRSTKEDLKKGLNQIQSNAERISTIIQHVREYIYRNEDVEEDLIPLKSVINNVLVFYGQRLKNHDIELRLKNIDKVFVSGHQGQYEQAILNLISNSFDAIDKLNEKKWIEISAEKARDSVRIIVKDSGHGIPSEVQTKMLEPFFSTKKGKGSGLGLTLVRGIAQKHGGDLRYEEGPNTTFVLELPQAENTLYHH
jgi:two-component system NtrC family sensor kinase